MATNIDTSNLIPVDVSGPNVAPPLERQPTKSPYFQSQMPSTGSPNADNVETFYIPGIPQYRIVPPPPLALAGSGTNSSIPITVSSVFTPVPPAPMISELLITIPTGYEFAFRHVNIPSSLPATAVIDSYKVYRNSTNSLGSAIVLRTIPHNPAAAGQPVTVQDSQPNGVTMFYWVSAVNVSGIESSKISAQTGTVTSTAGFNSNSQLAGTFNNNPVNSNGAVVGGVNPVTANNAGVITIAACSIQFGAGPVAYSGGSVSGNTVGVTYFVYADDPTFAGGAVSYHVTTVSNDVYGANGRVYFGKVTVPAGAPVGGGGGGNGSPSCFSGNTLVKTLYGDKMFGAFGTYGIISTKYGWRFADLLTHEFKGWMLDMGDGELVTLRHHIENDSSTYVPAENIWPEAKRVWFEGTVFNFHVRTNKEAEHHYILSNGRVAHNYNKL